tara:strand:+ start:629 stop:1864 length:1236 start_codon:yes stop_codon:yes gene_type:complete
MQVILQSGGVGSRLFPLTNNKPKCFLKLNGKLIFDYQYENLKKYNLHKKIIIISNNNHIHYFQRYFKNKKYKPKIISEKPGLGSGGSLIRNIKFIEKKFILIYLDIFFKVNFKNFLNKYKNENKIFSHKTDHKFDSDVVVLDKNNRIKKIIKKKSKKKILTNISISGLFFLKKKFLSKYNKANIDLTDIIIKELNKTNFYSYFSNEKFSDFGTIDRFNKLKKNFNLKQEKKVIFFDRDGTIISEKEFVDSINKIKFIDQFLKFINKIKKKNMIFICITNQPGIAKGFISEKKLEEIHLKINSIMYQRTGVFFDKFYYCPHYPISGFKKEIKKFKIICKCRKPKPAMFLKAINDFNLDKKNIYNIGNSEIDMHAGYSAGIKKNFLLSENKKSILYNKNYVEINYENLISKIK